jgi:hypothetical protein
VHTGHQTHAVVHQPALDEQKAAIHHRH